MRVLLILSVVACLYNHPAKAQSVLTLQDCYERAEANYPLIRQRELIGMTRDYTLENASKARLPQVGLYGQATYQSDVTRIPVDMPGVEPLSKDQYKVFGEVSQSIYDGGVVSVRHEVARSTAEVEQRKLEVELYQVRGRINDLFFGILLMQEQISQTELVKSDLNTSLKKVEAAILNGTALRSAADVIRVEILKLEQRIVGMRAGLDSYRANLGLFINASVDESTTLVQPEFSEPSEEINRPELRVFSAQALTLSANERMISAVRRPKVELFLQGGYGRPALNMLENTFELYYVGGVRFAWMISGSYTSKNEREMISLQRRTLDSQKETFLFNMRLSVVQQNSEITKLRRLIAMDEDIIALRQGVRATAEAQLDQGIISPSDFIREVNAEDQARQERVLHETQLLAAIAKHHYTTGQQ